MKSLFPNLEIYKDNEDVAMGDVPKALIGEIGQLFKRYGFSMRFILQTGQEKETQRKSFLNRLFNFYK